MAGRSIHNNIRLIIDLLEYSEWIEEDGFILFLDFKKRFDMLEHSFFFQALTVFWFGDRFVNIIRMIYRDINSSISLPFGTI